MTKTSKLSIAARVLMGALFLFSGLNGLFHFMPMPPMPPAAGAFAGALAAAGYFLPLLKIIEIATGVLLVSGRFVPLALTIAAPIVVNIVAFHIALAPEGLGIPLVLLGAELYLAWTYRAAFAPLLRAKPKRRPRPSAGTQRARDRVADRRRTISAVQADRRRSARGRPAGGPRAGATGAAGSAAGGVARRAGTGRFLAGDDPLGVPRAASFASSARARSSSSKRAGVRRAEPERRRLLRGRLRNEHGAPRPDATFEPAPVGGCATQRIRRKCEARDEPQHRPSPFPLVGGSEKATACCRDTLAEDFPWTTRPKRPAWWTAKGYHPGGCRTADAALATLRAACSASCRSAIRWSKSRRKKARCSSRPSAVTVAWQRLLEGHHHFLRRRVSARRDRARAPSSRLLEPRG